MTAGVFLAVGAGGRGGAVARAADSVIADDGTRTVDFTKDWKFFLATRTPTVTDVATLTLADQGVTTAEAIAPGFDDSGWRTVTVPHDFSIEGTKVPEASNSQAYLQGGLGWYRKTFTVPDTLRVEGKRVMIDFESVYQNSVVYLNGQLVGTYPSGYTGFSYDLTERLNYGGANTIAVKVQNPAPSGRWYTGSGIVGPVNLVITDPVRFTRHGVDLSSPTLEQTYTADGSAQLRVSAGVYSDATNGVISVRTTVLDAEGDEVAVHQNDPIETNPSNLATLSDTITVPDVELWYPWNIGEPYLYTVRTELFFLANGTTQTRLVDTVETPFGFRWFRIDPGSVTDPMVGGLHVNGVYTKIQGVDLHHDSGALGAAQYRDAYDRQLRILMTMGVNAYRTAHNPPSKDIIELCSELGIIVVEEAYDGWGREKAQYDFGRFFLQPVPTDWAGLEPHGLTAPPRPGVVYQGATYLWSDWVIQEMVKRDRNEASVFMWSIGNEVRGVGAAPAWYQPAQYDLDGLGGATNINEYTEAVRLTEAIKDVDDDRLVVMGGDQERSVPALDSVWGRINRYLDGYGLNYNTAISVDRLMERYPDTFFFESESSSQTSSRGVYLDPKLRNTGINQTPGDRGGSNYDNDFASWTMSNEYGLKKDRDRKGFAGQFIWSGFDYLGEPTPYNVYPVGTSSFGAIDTAGFPKDSYFLFRSQWIDAEQEAQVHVMPRDWNNWRDGEEVEVWVNANVPTVELYLNGRSLGRKSFDVKETAYGKQYYETSEQIADDKTWPTPNGNTNGYASPGAKVIDASGDSVIAGGTNYGKLHLTWQVPFEEGVLEARAFATPESQTPVTTASVATAGAPYTVSLEPHKTVIAADGKSLSYVEATVVDEDGNVVPDAANLLKFDVTGGAIVGVDNGQLESTEPYKWGGVERSRHSERSAYAGKALVILQSNDGQAGTMQLVARADGLVPAAVNVAVTADGTGQAPAAVELSPELTTVLPVGYALAAGEEAPVLPRDVRVVYTDPLVGRYEVVRPVTWAAIPAASLAQPGEVTVTGTVDGVTAPATAHLSVVAAGASVDQAGNPALGANNAAHDWADVPFDSDLRDGALATASFTGAVGTYPNNMLDGNAATFWSNSYSRGASVLLPAENRSRPYEHVEFYWDSARVLDGVSLQFVVDGARAVPATFEVEYWDGLDWQPVTGLTSETVGSAATMSFAPVASTRLRVGMENATPYSATGNIAITEAQVLGPDLPANASKAQLRALLARAATLSESVYTPESWAPLVAAVDASELVLADGDATADEIAVAVEKLRAALAGLSTTAPAPEPTPSPSPSPDPTGSPDPTDPPSPQPTATVTVTVTVTAGPSPAPTVTVTAQPTATPTVTVTAEPSPAPTVTVTATQTVTAGPSSTPTVRPSTPGRPTFVRTIPYTMPGSHDHNGRQWVTSCEPYSQTERCRTEIWATVVKRVGNTYVRETGWVFNNLTYLPFMTRSQWANNPLGRTAEWTAADGAKWKTECDTPATGRDACRSYRWTTVYTATAKPGGGYLFGQENQWVFNNIVMFGNYARS